jgi:hypothetical protein
LAKKRRRTGKKRKDATGNAESPSIPEEDKIDDGFDLRPAHVKDRKEGKIGSAKLGFKCCFLT